MASSKGFRQGMETFTANSVGLGYDHGIQKRYKQRGLKGIERYKKDRWQYDQMCLVSCIQWLYELSNMKDIYTIKWRYKST